MTYLAVMTAFGSFGYVMGDPQQYDAFFRDKYLSDHEVVLLHGMAATVALVLGPFQFLSRFRMRLPGVHRAVGMLYLLGVTVGGLTGLRMGLAAFGGTSSICAFCLVAMLWLYSAWRAIEAVRRHRYDQHRMWMLRNYALTFGAVQLRLYLYVFQVMGCSFVEVYPYVAWLAWLPNIVLVELIFGRGWRSAWLTASSGVTIGRLKMQGGMVK